MSEAKRYPESDATPLATSLNSSADFDERFGEPDELSGGRATEDALAPIAEEIATYCNHLPQLMREQAGQFVLIKGAEIVGTFPDRSAALREGYRRFGIVPFLVRQIADSEPVLYLPNVVP